MGYELHITRRKNWFDKEDLSIDFQTWQSFVDGDSELQIVGFAETILPDNQVLRIEAAGLTTWNRDANSETVCLMWDKGNISCKNPDDALITKLVSIATQLQARVQGDEGEFYY